MNFIHGLNTVCKVSSTNELNQKLLDHTIGLNQELEKLRYANNLLQKSRENLNLALHFAQMGTWTWEINKNLVIWSEHVPEIFGNKHMKLTYHLAEILNFIHPEDREKFSKKPEEELYWLNFRIIHSDQTVHHIMLRGKIIFDHHYPIRMIGVCFEI